MEHFKPSRLAICCIEENKHYTILNHLGDLGVYTHNKKDSMFDEALKVLKELIDICLNALININQVDKESVQHQNFKVRD